MYVAPAASKVMVVYAEAYGLYMVVTKLVLELDEENPVKRPSLAPLSDPPLIVLLPTLMYIMAR